MINCVKNWDKDLNHSIFANEMKKFFPTYRILKTFTFLILLLVLAFSPCGLKQSLKQVFNIDNGSSHVSKTTSSCQFVQTQVSKKTQQVAVIKKDHEDSALQFSVDISSLLSNKIGFKKARSVPLYILYQQLRTSLV